MSDQSADFQSDEQPISMVAMSAELPLRKWMRSFGRIGPYLREEHCDDCSFFFDCLSYCVSIKAAPESREFYGWWLQLEIVEDGFAYFYGFGLYDKEGKWVEKKIPKKAMVECQRTLEDFYAKLHECIDQKFGMTLKPAEGLDDSLRLSAA